MKSIALFVIFMVVVAAHASPRLSSTGPDEFLERLSTVANERVNFLLKFMIPLIPHIYRIDGPLELDIPGLVQMDGAIKDGFVTGIPETKANLDVNTQDSTLTFALSNKYMKLFGREYKITGLALLTGSRFNGTGVVAAELKNLNFFLSTKLIVDHIDDKLSIAETNIDISFDKFVVEMENMKLDGQLVNWDEINQMLNNDFKKEWPETKSFIIQEFEVQINDYLKGLSLEDILRTIGA
jgi:hypothetical protein